MAVLSIVFGCAYDNLEDLHPSAPPCVLNDTISFTHDILPIFVNSCGTNNVACHQDQNSDSGYGLATYDDVSFTIDDSGLLTQSVTHDPSIASTKWMPQGISDKIDNCSIAKIQKWMNLGHLNN